MKMGDILTVENIYYREISEGGIITLLEDECSSPVPFPTLRRPRLDPKGNMALPPIVAIFNHLAFWLLSKQSAAFSSALAHLSGVTTKKIRSGATSKEAPLQ